MDILDEELVVAEFWRHTWRGWYLIPFLPSLLPFPQATFDIKYLILTLVVLFLLYRKRKYLVFYENSIKIYGLIRHKRVHFDQIQSIGEDKGIPFGPYFLELKDGRKIAINKWDIRKKRMPEFLEQFYKINQKIRQ